jgi:hypothetical protein
MSWADLLPDHRMVVALDAADGAVPRSRALGGGRELKHKWSNRFADACAQMVADEIRKHPRLSRFEIRPNSDGSGKEARTFIAAGKKKQVDVIVATLASGLQMGFSLKGLNFVGPSGNYDHNLTGRTYELQDEVGAIHEYQAAAFVVGLYFLPLLAAEDKTNAPSSFARTVAHLRARAGRFDHTLPSQLRRCDAAAVGLYAAGDPGEQATRGVVRYLDVLDSPPRRGRPLIESTLDLAGLIGRFADRQARDEITEIDWADPEL